MGGLRGSNTKTQRIIRLLETSHKENPQFLGLTCNELSKTLEIPFNSVSGTLAGLVKRGVIVKDTTFRPFKFRLPPEPLTVSDITEGSLDLKMEPSVDVLGEAVAQTLHKYIRENDELKVELAGARRIIARLQEKVEKTSRRLDLSKVLVHNGD